jgi:hypothetical protein
MTFDPGQNHSPPTAPATETSRKRRGPIKVRSRNRPMRKADSEEESSSLRTARAVLDTIPGSLDGEYDEEVPAEYLELRDSPHGRLWTTVIVESLKTLESSLRWQARSYPVRRETLMEQQGKLVEHKRRERMRKLEEMRRKAESDVVSCTQFFFSSDSPLSFVCDALGYELDLIRGRVREILTDVQLPESCEQYREAFSQAS